MKKNKCLIPLPKITEPLTEEKKLPILTLSSLEIDPFKNVKKLSLKDLPPVIRKNKTNSHLTPVITKSNSTLSLKKPLLLQVDKLDSSSNSLNKKLKRILTEDDVVFEKENSKTNNFHFNFDVFNKTGTINHKEEPTFSKAENIYYLNRYSLMIRDKIQNEQKAQEEINALKKKLMQKKKSYQSLDKKISNLYNNFDDNKLEQSKEVEKCVESITNIQNDAVGQIIERKMSRNQSESLLSESYKKAVEITDEVDSSSKAMQLKEKSIADNVSSLLDQLHSIYLEIKQTKKEIDYNIKKSIAYYLDLLFEGKDTRNEGVVWIVRKLLLLDYVPTLKDFPKCFDINAVNYVIEIAKKQNENTGLIEEIKKYKKEILSMKSEDIVPKGINKNINIPTREKYMINKMDDIMKRHDYSYPTQNQLNKIQICLKTNKLIFYKEKVNEMNQYGFGSIRSHSAKSKGIKINKIFDMKKIKKETGFKNLGNDKKVALLEKIIEIKRVINENEYFIEKLKIEKYSFYKKTNNDEFINALFGCINKFKFA